MSATITKTNSSQQAPARLLADYDLHHSGQSNPTSKAKVGDEQDPVDAPYWNVPHRRVPAYRPVDTNRDQSQIRVYNHPIERMFITTMFTGVFINASAAKIWRASFGRLNENIFKYRIGGEI